MAHSPFDFPGSIKQLTLGFCLALNNWLSKTAAPDSSFFHMQFSVQFSMQHLYSPKCHQSFKDRNSGR
jgi:hypothetical protein